MKKIIFVMLLFFVTPLLLLQSKAQAAEISLTAENFPDAVMLKAVKKADKDGNGILSQKEIDAVTDLEVINNNKNVNIKNISVFSNLKKFTVSGKKVENLNEIYRLSKCEELIVLDFTTVASADFSQLQLLEKLTICFDSIGKLTINNTNLKEATIDIINVQNTEPIDLSGNTNLENLKLQDRAYERVNLSGNNYVKTLTLDEEFVANMNIQNMTNLEKIYLPKFSSGANGKLKKMTVSNCPKLVYIKIYYIDSLVYLKLNNLPSLSGVFVASEKLQKLDLSPFSKLKAITIESNKMTELKLPKKAPINNLSITGTKLKKIDLKNYKKMPFCYIQMPKLKTLNLKNNKNIRHLSVSDCHALKKVDLSKNKKIEKLYMTDNKKMQTIKLPKKNKIKFYTLNLMPKLTKINLGCLTKLKTLSASRITKIKKLDLSKLKKLDSFEWTHGSLTKIKWGKKSHYREINIKRNKLSGKLNLKPFTGLVFFYCNHNNYTEIIGGYYLVNFTCDYNKKLKKLDMRKSTELNGFSAYGVKKAKIYLYDSVMEFGPHLDTKNVKYVKKY